MHYMIPEDPKDQQDQTMFSPLEFFSSGGIQAQVDGTHAPTDNVASPVLSESHSFLYLQDDDLDNLEPPLVEELDDQDAPSVLPFQSSAAMSAVVQPSTVNAHRTMRTSSPSSPQGTTQGRSVPWLNLSILLIVTVVVVTLIGGSILVFAEPGVPLAAMPTDGRSTGTTAGRSPAIYPPMPTSTSASSTPKAVPRPSPTPSVLSTQGKGMPPEVGGPSLQLLQQMGWTQAGRSLADAVEAQRTATTFVDREMSYDFRIIGTPEHHGGTLTNATFLLTDGAKSRFIHHDVRMSNNTLYNTISEGKVIQQVVGPQSMLVAFQIQTIQGQPHQFAWLTVSFGLFQSSIDQTTGHRLEGFERDPATGQPRLHQMVVLLVRVNPELQGTGAPMGGTGWLVNDYALDATTLPAVATTPSL